MVGLAVAGVILALATDDREPSIVLAWLLVILLVPMLGLVAYFFVGRNHRRASRRRDRQRAEWQRTQRQMLEPLETSQREFSEATVH